MRGDEGVQRRFSSEANSKYLAGLDTVEAMRVELELEELRRKRQALYAQARRASRGEARHTREVSGAEVVSGGGAQHNSFFTRAEQKQQNSRSSWARAS